MDAGPKSEPILNAIQLVCAVLCADCEVISDSPNDVCAVCGSRSLLSLGRVLGGSIGHERAVIVPEDQIRPRHTFTLLVNRDSSPALRRADPSRAKARS
jgi:hypothetical protein